MIIEQTNDYNYVKVPDKTEQELTKVINRFFETNDEVVKGSREEIILETQKRLRPLIGNMVKKIAWIQGQEIFEQQLKSVMEEQVKIITDKVFDKIKDIKTDILEHKSVEYEIPKDNMYKLDIPGDIAANEKLGDVIYVFRNGSLQRSGVDYLFEQEGSGLIKTIDFGKKALMEKEIIVIKFWMYQR